MCPERYLDILNWSAKIKCHVVYEQLSSMYSPNLLTSQWSSYSQSMFWCSDFRANFHHGVGHFSDFALRTSWKKRKALIEFLWFNSWVYDVYVHTVSSCHRRPNSRGHGSFPEFISWNVEHVCSPCSRHHVVGALPRYESFLVFHVVAMMRNNYGIH